MNPPVRAFIGKLLKEDDADILRDSVQALAQMIMDVEVSSKIGAGPYERSDTRTAYRNGRMKSGVEISRPRRMSGSRPEMTHIATVVPAPKH